MIHIIKFQSEVIINLWRARKCRNTPAPLGRVPRIGLSEGFRPAGMGGSGGASCLDVKETYYQGHYDARRNCGKDIHKELSHWA
jgi:hypothetical protein